MPASNELRELISLAQKASSAAGAIPFNPALKGISALSALGKATEPALSGLLESLKSGSNAFSTSLQDIPKLKLFLATLPPSIAAGYLGKEYIDYKKKPDKLNKTEIKLASEEDDMSLELMREALKKVAAASNSQDALQDYMQYAKTSRCKNCKHIEVSVDDYPCNRCVNAGRSRTGDQTNDYYEPNTSGTNLDAAGETSTGVKKTEGKVTYDESGRLKIAAQTSPQCSHCKSFEINVLDEPCVSCIFGNQGGISSNFTFSTPDERMEREVEKKKQEMQRYEAELMDREQGISEQEQQMQQQVQQQQMDMQQNDLDMQAKQQELARQEQVLTQQQQEIEQREKSIQEGQQMVDQGQQMIEEAQGPAPLPEVPAMQQAPMEPAMQQVPMEPAMAQGPLPPESQGQPMLPEEQSVQEQASIMTPSETERILNTQGISLQADPQSGDLVPVSETGEVVPQEVVQQILQEYQGAGQEGAMSSPPPEAVPEMASPALPQTEEIPDQAKMDQMLGAAMRTAKEKEIAADQAMGEAQKLTDVAHEQIGEAQQIIAEQEAMIAEQMAPENPVVENTPNIEEVGDLSQSPSLEELPPEVLGELLQPKVASALKDKSLPIALMVQQAFSGKI